MMAVDPLQFWKQSESDQIDEQRNKTNIKPPTARILDPILDDGTDWFDEFRQQQTNQK